MMLPAVLGWVASVVPVVVPVDEFVCEDGQGFCGWIANQRVLFGSREMMANHNIEGLPTKTREAELAEGNGDVLYLSVSGMLAALFSIRITADPMSNGRCRHCGRSVWH